MMDLLVEAEAVVRPRFEKAAHLKVLERLRRGKEEG